ncbi:MAG: hypothetical protein ABIJ21_06045 [Nanoarchaeota archaeon]
MRTGEEENERGRAEGVKRMKEEENRGGREQGRKENKGGKRTSEDEKENEEKEGGREQGGNLFQEHQLPSWAISSAHRPDKTKTKVLAYAGQCPT